LYASSSLFLLSHLFSLTIQTNAVLAPPIDENARRMSVDKFSLVTPSDTRGSISGLHSGLAAANASNSSLNDSPTSSPLNTSGSSIPVPYPATPDSSTSSSQNITRFVSCLHTFFPYLTVISANFTITRVGSIESNGKGHKVTIAMLTLLSKYMYFAVPKLSPHAYLKGRFYFSHLHISIR
jgi:hypothetical protein